MIVMQETIQWIDVLEDMPDDWLVLLIVGKCGINTFIFMGYWDKADSTWQTTDRDQIEEVTYWAKLPIGPRVVQ